MKVEQSGGLKAMTDEQLDEALEVLRDLLARRAEAALIDVTPSLPDATQRDTTAETAQESTASKDETDLASAGRGDGATAARVRRAAPAPQRGGSSP
jgi:GTPase